MSREKYSLDTSGKEIVVVLLSGEFILDGVSFSRVNVFDQPAQGFYVADNGCYELIVDAYAEVCIIDASSDKIVPLQVLSNESVMSKVVGNGNFTRNVITLIDKTNGLEKLIVGETFKEGGNWSSWPPHKHDTYVENEESQQEEVYLYKFRQPNGYGIQMIYEEDARDASVYVVTNNQEVKIQKGYHPVVASPSSEMYYLWALFGDNKFFKTCDDPRFLI